MTNGELEELLRHETFVRALAGQLLGDRAQAEDVVQETWLAALQSTSRPKRHRSWLAGIVRNLVRRTLRGHDRRARREQLAARPPHVPSTDELYAEETVRRRVIELVQALPDIYRVTILLRFYEGLPSRVIAERLGLRGSTVRMRLKRGLALIRQQLLREYGGDGRGLAWILGALAFGATPRARAAGVAAGVAAATLVAAVALLGQAERPPARIPATAWRGPAARGGAASPARAMTALAREGEDPPLRVERARATLQGIVHLPAGVSTRTARVAALVEDQEIAIAAVDGDAPFALTLDAAASRVVATHPETEPGTAEVRGRSFEITLERRALADLQRFASPEPGSTDPADGPAAAACRRKPEPWERDPSFPAATAILAGIVHVPEGADVAPVTLSVSRPEGLRLRVSVPSDTWFVLRVERLLAEPLPVFLRLDASHPDARSLRADVPVFVDPKTGAPRLRFVELYLDRARTLRGSVTFEDSGQPAAGATVVAFPAEGDVANATQADRNGSWTLEVGVAGEWFVAAAAHGYRPAERKVEENDEVAPLLLKRGATLEGHVRVAGAPVPAAVVRASLSDAAGDTLKLDDGIELVRTAGKLAWRTIALETDAEGAFKIGGLDPAEYRVEVEGLDVAAQRVFAPGTAEFSIAPALVVVAVSDGGVPLPGARVAVAGAERVTDARGEVAMAVPPGASLLIAVSARGHGEVERPLTAPAQGAAKRLEVDLAAPSELAALEVRLDSLDGLPLPAHCDFDFLRLDGVTVPTRRSASVALGRYVLRDLEPGVYLMVALPGEYFLPTGTIAILTRGATEPVRLGVRAGGRVTVRLDSLTGKLAPPVDVRLEGPTFWDFESDHPLFLFGSALELFLDLGLWNIGDGVLASGLLPAGRYVLHVQPLDPGFAPATQAFDVIVGATTQLTIPLVRR